MKRFIKMLSIGILFSSLCMSVFAEAGQGNPVVKRTLGLSTADEYTFSNGEILTLDRDEKHIFLVVNGTILPNATVKVVDGYSLVPLNMISEELGMQVKWQKGDSNIIIEKGKTSVKAIVGEKKAKVNGKEIDSGTAVTILNDTLYVPVRFIAQVFSLSLGYIPYTVEGIEPISQALRNPIITIDENTTEKVLTEEEAKAIAEKQLTEKYNQFVSTGYYAEVSRYKETLSQLQGSINRMSVQGKTSRYWIFNGPKTILVDEYNGNVFFLSGGYTTFIHSINEDKSGFQIFASGYFAG